MKRNGYFLILVVFAIFGESCKKTSGIGGSAQTLQQYFSSASQYTLFYKALQRASLDTLLGGAMPYTVFAVADSNMMKNGYTSAAIDTIDIQSLRRTLSYQLVPGSISLSNLQYYQEVPLVTADSNIQAYLENNNYGLFYNGIPVIGVDSEISNGIIQQLPTMAVAPVGDLVATIKSMPSLSDFYYYSTIFNSGSYLTNPTPAAPATLYLPGNAAYAALGLDNLPAIKLQGSINNYYWGYGADFTNDFFGGTQMAGYFSGSLPIAIWFTKDGYDFYITDFATNSIDPSSESQIVKANIVATNGVIHIIQPGSY